MLERIEEVAWARSFSVGFGWDDWDDRSLSEGCDEGVGVEGLVGDQDAEIDGFNERLSASQIVILAQAEHHFDRITEGHRRAPESWWPIGPGIGPMARCQRNKGVAIGLLGCVRGPS